MKLLALLFLVGFGLASAVPVPSNELALETADDLETLFAIGLEAEEDDEVTTELGKKLRDHLDEILEKIKDMVDKGKGVKEDYLQKLKEIREKMKEAKIEIGKKGRELLERIKDKAKDYWKQILDRLRPESYLTDIQEDYKNKLTDAFNQLLEKFKETFEKGDEVSDFLKFAVKELRDRLQKYGIDMDQKARDFYEKMNEGEAKEAFKNFLEKIGIQIEAFAAEEGDDDEPKTELGKKLREKLDEILQKIKEAIEQGKVVKEENLEKMREIHQKLKDMREDVGKKARELFEKIKEKSKDYFKNLWEKLGISKREAEEGDDDEPKTELGKKLREKLDEILQKIKEAIEQGKVVKEENLEKMREIRQKLRDMREDVGKKARELFEKIKEKSKDYFKNLWEKLGISKREAEDNTENDIETKIKKQLDEFMEKLKENKFHLGEKEKDLLRQIRERTRNYWKPVLERLGLEKHIAESYSERLAIVVADEETVLIKVLKEKYEQLFQEIKNEIEKCSDLKLDEIREKMWDISQKIIEKEFAVHGKIEEKLKEIREEIKNRYSIGILEDITVGL